MSAISSTGLSSRTAAALAYSGWWVTGAIMLLFERRDPFVRRHSAQSLAAFGLISLAIVLLIVLALASLSFLPVAFGFLVVAAGVMWLGGVVVWWIAMWTALNGRAWRLPIVDDLIGHLERTWQRS